MLPVLQIAADGNEHRISDVVDQLARKFKLTEVERQQLLPSGKQATFSNRVHWARTYLVQAGLLEPTKRAHFRITARGKKSLDQAPSNIDNEYLSQFSEFNEFRGRSRISDNISVSETAEVFNTPLPTQTPDELIRNTVTQIETVLRKELLNRILSAPPAFFESLIISLLLAMGYGGSRKEAGQIVGRSGDGGIDGVIDQDALGLDRVYIQAKRYAIENAIRPCLQSD